jgi:hypothetical protein
MSPAMKCTSRDSRSSLATRTEHRRRFAAAGQQRAAAAVEGVRPLPRFHLDELGGDLQSIRGGKSGAALPLGIHLAKATASLKKKFTICVDPFLNIQAASTYNAAAITCRSVT